MAFSWELYNQMPVIGILRNIPPAVVQKILPLYGQAGFSNIEITMNSVDAGQMIQDAVAQYGSDLNIGAGTVCSEQDLAIALQAGATFVVTPVINASVIKTCVQNRIPVFPGAYSPTEIYNAWTMGASMVKVFPANRLGPEYIQEVKAPLNQVKLLPTGGVSVDNFIAFLQAGADGVGMGSQLFSKSLLATNDWPSLLAHLKSVYNTYQNYLISSNR